MKLVVVLLSFLSLSVAAFAASAFQVPSLGLTPPSPNQGRFHYSQALAESQVQTSAFGKLAFSVVGKGYRIAAGQPVSFRYFVDDQTGRFLYGLTVYHGRYGSRIVAQAGSLRVNGQRHAEARFTWKRPPSGSFHVCLEAIDLSDRGPNRGHSAVCEVVVAR